MKLKYFALLIQLLIWIEVPAQSIDTLFYEGSSSLEFRYLTKSESISNEIFRICQLDSGLMNNLHFTFQILRDGTVNDIRISGDLSNYRAKELKDRLSSEKLFKPVNSNKIVYYSCYMKGNIESTNTNDSEIKDVFSDPPLTSRELVKINQKVTASLKQNFNTTEEKVKTFIQLTLEANKPIKKLKIRKGTSHLNDHIIASLVAKEVFNNKDYIYHVHRSTAGMKKSLEIILPITTPTVWQDSIALPYKLICHPKYRLKRKIQYDGINLRGSDVSSYMNDSSLVKISETEYSYNEYNQVNLIKKVYYKKDSVFNTIDSLVYYKEDSVTATNGRSGHNLNKKLFNQPSIIQSLSLKRKPSFSYGNHSYSFLKSDGRIVTQESTQKYTSGFKVKEKKEKSHYHYDSLGRISMVIQEKSKVKRSYMYHDNGYVETWSDNYWSDQNYYYFDDNGYLIARVNISDTQPYVTKYEYELGWGNASLFENNRFIEPRIY